MELNKIIEIGILLDLYGSLLTDKQRDVMQLYFLEDFSLGEIGEELSISRQAIHDTIKKSEKLLYEYEQKLGMLQQQEKNKAYFQQISDKIDQFLQNPQKENQNIMEMMYFIKDICKELSE